MAKQELMESRNLIVDRLSSVLFEVLIEQHLSLTEIWNEWFGCEPFDRSDQPDDDWNQLYDEFLSVVDADYFEEQQAIFEAKLEIESLLDMSSKTEVNPNES